MMYTLAWSKEEIRIMNPIRSPGYMMIEKPVIGTVTGTLLNSQLKEMISEANNGIVWEEANDETDYPLLKEFILDQYNRFIRNEPVCIDPNREYIEQYSYVNLTKEFVDIINKHKN